MLIKPLKRSELIKLFYFNYMHKILDFSCPKTYTEKIQWLKLYSVNDLMTYCTDKITVRDYVKNNLNIDLSAPILLKYNNFNEFNIDHIPDNSVIKCNHGSGWNILYLNKYEIYKNFDLNNKLNNDEVYYYLKQWYISNYSTYFGYENNYLNIKPCIFIEPYINIDSEYKFFCFNGVPKLCQVIFYDDKYKYDLTWDRSWSRHDLLVDMNFEYKYEFFTGRTNETEYLLNNYKTKMPEQFYLMQTYSQQLAKPFKFVRCDFYKTTENKIYLSELTFFPSSGIIKFDKETTDLEIGNMLNLN